MPLFSLSWTRQYYAPLLLAILAVAFISRTWHVSQPERYIFDEVYHAVTAKLIAQNDPRAFEWWNPPVEENTAVDWLHPPLAKYTQALSILLFGEHTFGWRFSSVIFGVVVVWLTAELARTVSGDERVALLAALFASADGLLLVQSRIAMNDIHVTAAILGVLLLYAKSHPKLHVEPETQSTKRIHVSTKRILLIGAVTGVAMATKWSGLFALVVIWLFELLSIGLSTEWRSRGFWPNWLFSRIAGLLAVPLIVYISAYAIMFAQGKDLEHFIELHKQIYWYQTNLKAEHPYQSRPWQWVTDLRPVWYHVDYKTDTRGDIYAFGNPVLFWAGAVAVLVGSLTLLKQFGKQLQGKSITAIRLLRAIQTVSIQPLGLLIASYFAVWLPWQFSPRIMFFYHYAPAVPLLAIVLAWLVWKHPALHKLSAFLVLLIVATFVVWYPHWTGIPVSNEFKESVYFVTERWK